MKTLIQTVMAVPIAERIGKAFGQKSLLATGAELITAKLVLRSFGAMLALGAVAGGISWLARSEAEGADTGNPEQDAKDSKQDKRKSRKADKAGGA